MDVQFEPRITVMTLGVADVVAATAFYERIGFAKADGASSDGVAFFPLTGGGVLALYGRTNLAGDAGLPDAGSGLGRMSLAYNARSRGDVGKLVDAFIAAGGRLLKAPHDVFWGGYVGYAADPDGHLWEIAFNPHWELEDNGMVRLPN